MQTRRTSAAVLLAALVPLTLAACGSGDSEATSAKAAIKADILKSEKSGADASSPLKLNDTQAGCFASQLVDHLGVAQLKKDGILTKDGKVAKALSTSGNLKLPQADAGTFVSGLFDCTNGGGQVVTLFHDELAKQMTSIPTAAKTCINTKIDAALVRKILVATLSGQGQAAITAEITQITQGCMTAPS